MPFTADQFFDVFGRYNLRLWPVVVLVWVASAATMAWWLRAGVRASRLAAGVLAGHWAWSAVAFHAIFFATINPAARAFAALFVFEAICLAWLGVARRRLRFTPGRGAWKIAGYALVVYSFLYPALSLSSGHAWPRVPLYAVPCPTTLLTCGMLLMLDGPIPIAVALPAIAWAAIAASATVLFHVVPDFALLVAGPLVGLQAVIVRVQRRSGAAHGAVAAVNSDSAR